MTGQVTVCKHTGAVLITVILLITLMALFVLAQMQMVFLDHRALNQLTEQHQSFFQLEAEARKIAATVSIPSACIIEARDANEVIELLGNKQGCTSTRGKQQFYYLVEDLGLFPCLQTKVGNFFYSTQHLRISIRSREMYSAILQLRIAKSAKLQNCEQIKAVQSRLGLLSWRYLKADVG